MKKIIFMLSILVLSSSLYAGDIARKGTTGAEQLLIPVGARGIALSGSMLANVNGLESVYYNPAGLDISNHTEVMFNYMSYIGDINVSYFAASTKVGDFGSVGLSFKSLDFGDIPITTNRFPDGTGRDYSPSYMVAALTYSKTISDRISIGTNFKLVSEKIINSSANGLALDFGVQYRFNERLSLGASLKNIGTNMAYSGPDLQTTTDLPEADIGTPGGVFQITTESFQIPSYFEMSLAYAYDLNEQNSLMLGGAYTANNSLEDVATFGMEYGFMNTLFLRGGYNLLMENMDDYIYGFTVGAGIDYKIAADIGFVLDYAFRQVQEFPEPNHVFTVKLALL